MNERDYFEQFYAEDEDEPLLYPLGILSAPVNLTHEQIEDIRQRWFNSYGSRPWIAQAVITRNYP